jgi:hypothetical protein
LQWDSQYSFTPLFGCVLIIIIWLATALFDLLNDDDDTHHIMPMVGAFGIIPALGGAFDSASGNIAVGMVALLAGIIAAGVAFNIARGEAVGVALMIPIFPMTIVSIAVGEFIAGMVESVVISLLVGLVALILAYVVIGGIAFVMARFVNNAISERQTTILSRFFGLVYPVSLIAMILAVVLG